MRKWENAAVTERVYILGQNIWYNIRAEVRALAEPYLKETMRDWEELHARFLTALEV